MEKKGEKTRSRMEKDDSKNLSSINNEKKKHLDDYIDKSPK